MTIRLELRTLLILLFSIFIGETLVMILLDIILPQSYIAATFLDAVILSLLIFPMLYIFIYKPLKQEISKREQIGKALLESEERYRNLFKRAEEGIYILSATGKLIDVNDSFARMHGYNAEEMINMGLEDIDLPDTAKHTPERMHRLLNGEALTFEVEHYHKDGHIFPLEVSASLIHSEGESYIQCFHRDITMRKQAEMELLSQKNMLKVIFESSPNIICLIDKDGKVISSNKKGSEFSKANNTNVFRVFFGDILQCVNSLTDKGCGKNDVCANCITRNCFNEIFNNKKAIQNREGKMSFMIDEKPVDHYFLICADLVYINNNEFALLTIIDNTEQKKAELALNESSKFIRQIIHSTQEGIIVYDNDLKVQVWNPFMENLLDLPAIDVIGKHSEEFFPTLKDSGVIEAQEKALKGKITKSLNLPYNISKSGKSGWVSNTISPLQNLKGEIIGGIATVRDITEQKIAEEQIIKSEAKFRSYIENAPDGIFITDSQGFYMDVNNSACNLTGYTRAELLNMHTSQMLLEKDIHHAELAMEFLLKQGKFSVESVFKRKDGSAFYGLLSAVKISDNQFLGFLKNIDDMKFALQEMIKAKNKAEDADKLKSSFLANMSHEIRTPMNGIIGFSELLIRKNITEEKQHQYIKIIQESSSQLLAIIDDLIDISKIESNQIKITIEDVNLNQLLSEIYSLFKIKETFLHIELKLLCALDDPSSNFFTDRVRLKQILINLISNAAKFTSSGHVRFGYTLRHFDKFTSTSSVHRNAKQAQGSVAEVQGSKLRNQSIGEPVGQELEFFIEDTGIGIEEDKHKIIFDRFRQANEGISRTYGGTGLGLAISKSLIQLLGGKIWLSSEINKGTTFYFSLPFKQAPVDKKVLIQTISEEIIPFKNKPIVLVAEDEQMNFILMKEMLVEMNISIIHAQNGAEAIKLIQQNNSIKLVLMDLKMPVMGGLEATKIIKQFKQNLPVIAITAFAQASDKEKALAAGCDNYLSKPIRQKKLFSMIKKYL